MADPIAKTIADTIVTRVNAGTYTAPYQLKTAYRPNRLQTNKPIDHLECRVVFAGGQPNPEISHQGNPEAHGWTYSYDIVVFILPSDTSEVPLDDIVFRIHADLVKAITTPVATWTEWGVGAFNSDYEMSVGSSPDNAIPAAILTVNVHLRFDINNPENVRA